ncbi:hypothetical protein ACKI2N_004415 [Cupriavidus sp. 30B13]|uniref:hypothetical protein n=1 Tax=Cupriavidus sp. 30B13 TaxID=3384241 RepID=UPI003B91A6BC
MVKAGRLEERAFLTQVDMSDPGAYDNYGAVGVGAGGYSGGRGRGGSVAGVGLSFDVTSLFRRHEPQIVDLFQYKVRVPEGIVMVVAPSAPGLTVGACVRVLYFDSGHQPELVPAADC